MLILTGALLLIAAFVDRSMTPTGDAPVASSPRLEMPHIATTTVLVFPETIQQGEPALIAVAGLGTSTLASLSFDGTPVRTFAYGGAPAAIVGVDLNARTGAYPIIATLSDGRTFERGLSVAAREKVEAPLGIPQSLGGNTPAGERNVVTSLARDNEILASVTSTATALWSGPFGFPITGPVVTDEYGYTRLTGRSTIAHKGTDFRAATGTPVYAMNDGVVVRTDEFTIYGHTIIIDHGLGIHTLYMHLSEIGVREGQRVERGDPVGKSGKTGYSEFPHLHISVKINGVSVDPVKFLDLF